MGVAALLLNAAADAQIAQIEAAPRYLQEDDGGDEIAAAQDAEGDEDTDGDYPVETDEEREQRLAKEQAEQDANTKKDFENQFDQSEDFDPQGVDSEYGLNNYYQSGDNDFGDVYQDDIDAELQLLMEKGAIVEFLEPKARSFNNIPQAKSEVKRINCPMSDGTQKAHFLTTQGSKNAFEWRIKRSAKNGNCTVRVSVDGLNYQPLTPDGKTKFKFACGRKAGYESTRFTLPKNLVSESGAAVVQLELETEFGTIVQCSDMIIQPYHDFVPQVCDPACKNGGVCLNGVCKCGKMYEGDYCEEKGK